MQAVLGALVGDAAGGTLEFRGKITPELAREAMKMPGGGVLRLGPGQLTDDGELTLTLLRHILPVNDGFGIPTTNFTRAHAEWYDSFPFDMGSTCAKAFSKASEVVRKSTPEDKSVYQSLDYHDYQAYQAYVKEVNADSEANGAMMRATAIATWLSQQDEPFVDHIVSAAKADAELSHPSIVCQEANAIYVLAITCLLLNNTPEDTLKELEDYVQTKVTSEKVKQWFLEESLDISNLNCQVNIGHVRYGFVMAIYFLRHPDITYEEAIYQTLLKGGDTDTNAAIVGGLVGSYCQPPDYMLEPVLKFDCTKEGQRRPKEMGLKHFLEAAGYVKH
jgi:ADP-ribosyl-[dinitrogen reductase] hydrolase